MYMIITKSRLYLTNIHGSNIEGLLNFNRKIFKIPYYFRPDCLNLYRVLLNINRIGVLDYY